MSSDNLRTAIRQLAGTYLADTVHMVVCTVDSVDVSERTCDCTAVTGKSIQKIGNVQLMAAVDDGALYVPAIGSTVIVHYSEYNQPYVAMFSELDTVTLSAGIIQLNNGSFAGLVKVVELTEKLNALEGKVNDLINAFNTHVHTGVTSGTASSGTTASPVSGTLTPTQQSEIENEIITHGN